jgi:hypothetical protein
MQPQLWLWDETQVDCQVFRADSRIGRCGSRGRLYPPLQSATGGSFQLSTRAPMIDPTEYMTNPKVPPNIIPTKTE